MQIECLSVGPIQANCYLVWGPEQRALVIDPGAEPETILKRLATRRLEVACYLLTHGHADHIGALTELSAKRPAPYALHEADHKWAFSVVNQIPPFYPAGHRPSAAWRTLADGQNWSDGGLTCQVIGTPGHTPGSVCFYFPDERLLFSGDTLFQGSVGRTDLPGGDDDKLRDSLRKLSQLPPVTRILTGHGPETSLAEELRTNPFLQASKQR
ncbi:MAG: MBL fold metallo-hydrolase [Lentisphaerae bacterium]|nr:MBL fold metallo-hydrolase [Lentisphaerota bacterium]